MTDQPHPGNDEETEEFTGGRRVINIAPGLRRVIAEAWREQSGDDEAAE